MLREASEKRLRHDCVKVNITQSEEPTIPVSGLVSMAAWRKSIGRGVTTIWRWQRAGWLPAGVNINGKVFLTRKDIAEFEARAIRGDFSKPLTGTLAKVEGGAN